MVDERGTQARPDGAGMTGAVECRYYGRDFTAEEMALLRALIAADPQPTRAAVQRVLPAHRLVQARRRPQGHDGQGHHAGHAPRRPHRRCRRPGDGSTGPSPSSSDRTPNRRCSRPRQPSTRSARWTCAPSCAAPGRAVCGTSSSPATTISATRPLVGAQMRYAVRDRNGWPVAMLGFSTAAWKLAPRDNFIGWTPHCARRTSPSWSTTRGS